MQWLSGWLKELILLILIASFVDLMLPNNTFQRYVKTVVGLFLILVLISPVVQLFQNRWDVNQMIRAADFQQSNAGRGDIPSLMAITRDAHKLAAANERQAVEILESRLAEEVKSDLSRNTSERVESVQVTAQEDSEGRLYIERMSVVLSLVMPAEQAGSEEAVSASADQDRGIKPVRPIEPVQPVIIRIDSSEELAKETNAPVLPGGQSAELQSRREGVAQYLQQQWQMRPEQIELRFSGSDPPSEQRAKGG
ncbi:stage III sporulation protein AF [Paenibacillus sp. J2TS4]|uniref:stage III sporulation protein AF n=1 Tax=Paenibacillus sp. J2TS4 TaxID=2807194 RepID=UPI001B0E59C1|nr:stage III sporulation protein AF [Paenibacillus sp. J2TS4]GIP32266.1 hypothetical protein J2TS4_14760 [Paenibacillus sp. J2TS4]